MARWSPESEQKLWFLNGVIATSLVIGIILALILAVAMGTI